MLDYLTNPALFPIVRDALLAGLAVALMCGVLSPIVVVKKLGFVSQGVSHSAFAGIGVASMLAALGLLAQNSLAEFLVVVLSCIAAAVVIGAMGSRSSASASGSGGGGVSDDSIIGMVLVMAMALGALLVQASARIALERSSGFTPQSWESILFGSLLGAGPTEVRVGWLLAALVIVALYLVRRPLRFYILDEESAFAFGVPVARARLVLMVLLGIAVVTALRVSGVVLATALLVFPGAIALQVTDKWRNCVLLATMFAVISVIVGLGVSLETGAYTGPCIVGTLALMYAIARAATVLRSRRLAADSAPT